MTDMTKADTLSTAAAVSKIKTSSCVGLPRKKCNAGRCAVCLCWDVCDITGLGTHATVSSAVRPQH